jgi:hypothetical protein
MRWFPAGVLSLATICCVNGCLQAPVVPPTALLYTNIKAPLDIDAQNTPIGSRRGESSSRNILGLAAFGDASLRAAAEDGGLQLIQTADYSYFNILGVYQKYTTVVYGE